MDILKKTFFSSLVILFFLNIHGCCFEKVPKSSIDTGLDNPVSIDFSASCFAVANKSANTINIYNFDQHKCIVSDFPVSTLTKASNIDSPIIIKFSPNGKCLAVVNSGNNTVSFFQAQTACIFNPIAKSSINIGKPISLAFSSNAQCVAIGSSNNTVSVFPFDQILCLIDQVPTTILTAKIDNPVSLNYSFASNCFAVLNQNSNSFNLYKVNTDCVINPDFETIPTSEASNNIRFASTNNSIAVSAGTTQETSKVLFYSFDDNTCSANPTPVNTLDSTNGINVPIDINFSPNSGCFLVANKDNNNVQVFAFDSNIGQIIPKTVVELPATLPIRALFSPNSRCIGVLNINGQFNSFVNFFTFVKRSAISQAIQRKYCSGC